MKAVKTVLSAALMLLPLTGTLSAASPTRPADELKVMTWNIWHGGHSKLFPEKGCEGTLGILKQSEAYVILVTETYGASEQIAKKLGYEYFLISSNLSIYSRYPIVKTYTFPDVINPFCFGGVEIEREGKKLRVFNVWIPSTPDNSQTPQNMSAEQLLKWETDGPRDEDLAKILKLLKPFEEQSDEIPLIVGGDFNSHSHLDWTEATKDMYLHGGQVVPWPISIMMKDAGYKDSFREVNPDPVKNLGVTWFYPIPTGGPAFTEPKRSDRIDYIYYMGKGIQATHSESHVHDLAEMAEYRGKKFFYASDHGHLHTTFQLKGTLKKSQD